MTADWLHRLVHSYGLGFVFVVLVLDSGGLPLPGETAMIAAAFYAARSHSVSPWSLFLVSAAGAILGAVLGYALGWRFGTRLLTRLGPRFGYNADRQLVAHYLIDRYGAVLIGAGRFFAVLRPVENVLAGATGMAIRPFMAGNVAGGLAWTALYCFGIYFAGKSVTHLAGHAATVAGVVALLALIGGFWLLRRQEARLIEVARAAAARQHRHGLPRDKRAP